MSRFFSQKYKDLTPYTPGEQPKDFKYIKLNTNESPFPPSKKAVKVGKKVLNQLNLYSDPTCSDIRKAIAEKIGVSKDEIIFGNGSDELLYLSFLAFCDEKRGVAFADITYGFYKVYAKLNNLNAKVIPLKDDFSINIADYFNLNKTIFIANPNAPTGICLSLEQIEKIVSENINSVVIIDEAYVDFGGKSAIPLTKKYDNLLVIQTFSKSRSLAGARLGLAVGNKELINDLNTIRYSINPYNVNKTTLKLGEFAYLDDEYTKSNCNTIIENREFTVEQLKKLGFSMTESKANFIFVKHESLSGKKIYQKLKEKLILVRHFDLPRINEYVRITIGTKKQMQALISALNEIITEEK